MKHFLTSASALIGEEGLQNEKSTSDAVRNIKTQKTDADWTIATRSCRNLLRAVAIVQNKKDGDAILLCYALFFVFLSVVVFFADVNHSTRNNITRLGKGDLGE